MNKKFDEIFEIADNLQWGIIINDNEFNLQKYSQAGQDFNLHITANNTDEFISELKSKYENFDVSEETYLWLDNTGHGKNGAPYDMKDVYEDMESCKEMMLELLNKIYIL
ncbi:MAG: hypothetical protein ACOCUI_00875 [bacterium]